MGQTLGQAVGKGGGLMHHGPPKSAERMLASLVPPACREEVLGDLHERYRSPGQYLAEAIRTLPMIIVSRVCRITDSQSLLMHALLLYSTFLSAAWFMDRGLLSEQWGLLRPAIPAGVALLVLTVET